MTAAIINTIKHTGDENVVYVHPSSWRNLWIRIHRGTPRQLRHQLCTLLRDGKEQDRNDLRIRIHRGTTEKPKHQLGTLLRGGGDQARNTIKMGIHRGTTSDASTMQTSLLHDTKSERREPASGSESPFSRRKIVSSTELTQNMRDDAEEERESTKRFARRNPPTADAEQVTHGSKGHVKQSKTITEIVSTRGKNGVNCDAARLPGSLHLNTTRSRPQ